MLMAHAAMGRSVILLMVVILLAMVLMMRLVLVFLAHANLYIALMRCPIQHHILALAVVLVIHGIGIMRACLRDRRA